MYGYSSCNKTHGILFLRNPTDHENDISIDLNDIFNVLKINSYSLDQATYVWETIYCGECGNNDNNNNKNNDNNNNNNNNNKNNFKMPTFNFPRNFDIRFNPFQSVLFSVIEKSL
jgi:hypothetical protein